MTTTTTRACWNCGKRHQSSVMPALPALCSDTCIATWRKRFEAVFGGDPFLAPDGARHTNHGCGPDKAPITPAPSRHACVIAMRDEGLLRYNPATGQWIDQHGEPLSQLFQYTANELAQEGRLNRDFPSDEPRPADEPQPLAACPPTPPEPPIVRWPLVDPRGMVQATGPWWKRWFRHG